LSDVALRVEHLAKRYRIGVRKRHDTLRDTLADLGGRIWGRGHRSPQATADKTAPGYDHIWALQGVSFDVKQGEVVGIIGRNGAGKSTLLKILSRITAPTEGRVRIVGRLGSLLEVGTGFHAELTGRENIYLNGAILGMRKVEIERKLDEIVDFAEVRRFIDTPVKHYSTGMYLRLAFAVAAHLESEILLVDEVLAVGDARFQQKCMNKMRDAGQLGRTVLFVSHNMLAISGLCQRAILIDDGKVVEDGPSHQVVSAYLNAGRSTTAVREWLDPAKAPGRQVARLRAVRARTGDGRLVQEVDIRQEIGIEMEYEVLEPGHLLLPNFNFYNEEGLLLFWSHDLDPDWHQRRRPAGRYVSTAWIPGNLLTEGTVSVGAGMETVAPTMFQFWEPEAVSFRVVDSLEGDSARGDYMGHIEGVMRPRLKWRTELQSESTARYQGLAVTKMGA
jgi:lipopolysaccharide transport system ATP-binding protein